MVSKEGILVLVILFVLFILMLRGCGGCGMHGCHGIFLPGHRTYYGGRRRTGSIRGGSTGGRTYRGGGIGFGK